MAKNNIAGTLVEINGVVQNCAGTLVRPKIAYQNCAGTLKKIFDISASGATQHFWEACGLTSKTYTPVGNASSITTTIDGQKCTMTVSLSPTGSDSVCSGYTPYGPYAGYSYVHNNIYEDPSFYLTIPTYLDAIITLESYTGTTSFNYWLYNTSTSAESVSHPAETSFSTTASVVNNSSGPRIAIKLTKFSLKAASGTPSISLVFKALHRNYIGTTGYYITSTDAATYTEVSRKYEGEKYNEPYASSTPMYSITGYSGTFTTNRTITAVSLPNGTLQTASGAAVTLPAPPGSYRVFYNINSAPQGKGSTYNIPACIGVSYIKEL